MEDESKLVRSTLIMVGDVTPGGLITVEGYILERQLLTGLAPSFVT